ncbi:hypothetical protein L6164_016857 [Bauhinia variegata]|uniref:Uncharacterized protein n=1 Tax=Bauhinia variegata TaxID=167791 RepID=A0ACB9N812_BAUVA|nr:hypothetical protein L6164_016857 [Bauhinia variegata]
MELFAKPIIFFFLLILFTSWGFLACRTEDCGGQRVAYTIIVDHYGRGKFSTVQAAIDSVPVNNFRWVKIHIRRGVYIEKVHVPFNKPCIILEGEGRGITTITYNDREQTDRSATFISSPNNNSFDVLEPLVLNHGTLGSGTITQAVAAIIYGDKSAFFDCGFVGFQDTLWDALGRHYFNNCIIQGAVDFIFGTGQSYYEGCLLNVTSAGFVTAQGRNSANDPSGFVFRKCSVVGSGNGQVMLGRAYGSYSRVIFHGTYMGAVVNPQGWNSWHYIGQESKFSYAEVQCKGPGANTVGRVPWEKKLTGSQLKQFSKAYFINQDGWLDKLPI